MNDTALAANIPSGWSGWWRDGFRRFRQNRLSVLGLAIVVCVVAIGIAGPLIAPSGPFELVGTRLMPPQGQHPFGTDHLGRDVLSGVLYGTRTSLQVGFLSMALSVALGLIIGSVSGYFAGRLDDLLMRVTEIFQVMPRFFLALVIVALFGADVWGTIFVIG